MFERIANLFNSTEAIKPVPLSLDDLATNTDEDINYAANWAEIEQTFTGVLLGTGSARRTTENVEAWLNYIYFRQVSQDEYPGKK